MRKISLNNANLFRGERAEISGMGLRIKSFIQGNLGLKKSTSVKAVVRLFLSSIDDYSQIQVC